MNIEGIEMSDDQRTTWHYWMDIHDPSNYWYCLGLLNWRIE